MLPEPSINLPLAVAPLAQGSKKVEEALLVFDFEEPAGKNDERNGEVEAGRLDRERVSDGSVGSGHACL
jgi:hypothetical protein